MKNFKTKLLLLIAMIFFMVTPVFSAEYTLEQYLNLVKGNSKELMLAASQIRSAAETEKQARAQALPYIGFQGGYYRNFIDIEQAYPVESKVGGGSLIWDDIDVNNDWEFSFGLGLSQQLFNINVFNAIKASKEYKSMTQSDYEAQEDAIMTIAKQIFFQCYLLDKVYQIKLSTLDKTQDQFNVIKNKYENGLVSKLDYLRAETDYKNAIPAVTSAKMNLEVCLLNMKHIAGIDQDEEIALGGDFTIFPDMPEMIGIESIMENRPDYLKLLKEKTLREINVKASQANHYPTLTLDGSYSYSTSEDKFTKSFSENRKQVCKLGLKLELPVYTGGALLASDRQKKIELEQTEIKLRQKRESMITELREIYLRLQMEFENIAMAESSRITAQQAYDIAQVSFDNGVMTQLELKDTRVSLENAELSQVNSTYNYLCAFFDWQKATCNMERNKEAAAKAAAAEATPVDSTGTKSAE